MTMLTHPNDETLQRLRHAELAAHTQADVDEHLDVCVPCRERSASLAREEHEVLALLESLDQPARRVRVDLVVARARSESRLARYRLAASVVLAATLAGVAYAMPGSPLEGWIRSVIARVVGESPRSQGTTPVIATSGVAVAPGARFVIRFAVASAAGEARVSLTEDSTISVRAALGSATFTSEADRLLIEPRDSTLAVEIQIPRLAPRVEIQVAGARVFLKSGTQITTLGKLDSRERYRVPLTAPR